MEREGGREGDIEKRRKVYIYILVPICLTENSNNPQMNSCSGCSMVFNLH